MRTIKFSILMLAVGIAVSVGCSDEEQKKPCPTKGIGVETPGGTACASITDSQSDDWKACREQYENYKAYGCSDPQICPDQGYRMVPDFIVDPLSAAEPLSFILTNCSTGNQDLKIQKIEIAGDERCYFSFDSSQDVKEWTIRPGNNTIIQVRYKPLQIGQDHAHIRIHTENAKNFNPLVIPICGRAVLQQNGEIKWDGGVGDGGSGTSNHPPLRCKDVGTKFYPCHQK